MAHVIYIILFLGLPVAGIVLYCWFLVAMSATRVAAPPRVALFWVFAAYGTLSLYIVSTCCGEWSGMHSLGLPVLFIVLPVWLPIQGFLWRRTFSFSAYHRNTIALSFGFPFVIAMLVLIGLALDEYAR